MPKTWNQYFLSDIGAPDSSGNEAFLNAWENREGASGFANNPLATMQGGFGGTPGTHGIMSYGDAQSGAAANAKALENGRYGDILGALRSGNANPNTNYGGLSTWSGGGYSNVAGGSTTPGGAAGIAANLANQQGQAYLGYQSGLTAQQLGIDQNLANQNASYAQTETGYQLGLEGLSEQGLGVQLGALGRQLTLDPKLYGLQQQQNKLSEQGFSIQGGMLQQQAKDIQRGYKTNLSNTRSSQAGSGTAFTGGGRQGLANITADFQSAMKNWTAQHSELALQRKGLGLSEQREALQYKEQMSQLGDQGINLGIQAKRLGISKEELLSRLQNTEANIFGGFAQSALGLQQQGFNQNLAIAGQFGGLPLSAVIGGVPGTTGP